MLNQTIKLGTSIVKNDNLPLERYQYDLEFAKRQIAYEIYKELDDGQWHAVTITHDEDWIDKGVRRITIIARVRPVNTIAYKVPKLRRLTLLQRLRVLFTGWIAL